MTFDERVQAIGRLGFTERQARFLVTVMRHSGVCVPRQYATFCGIVHGEKTRKFFAKLERLGCARIYDCRHNRARIYHLNQKALYRVIGQADSRLRRTQTLGHAVEHLMLLDAIVESPDMVWLATAEEKAEHILTLLPIDAADLPHVTVRHGETRTVRPFPDHMPIGIHPTGRGLLVYLLTTDNLLEFRVFLERHAPLLRAMPAWTLRIVVPPHLASAGEAAHKAVYGQLMTALEAPTVQQIGWCFSQVQAQVIPSLEQVNDRCKEAPVAFAAPRFRALYRTWKQDGDRALDGVSSRAILNAVNAGWGRIDVLDLGHRYGHLAPLVTVA